MTVTQQLIQLMAHPHCSEVNNAMQQLTSINYTTNEQHKDTTNARQERDIADICELVEFLETQNPFSDAQNLRSIATGISADRVNVGHREGCRKRHSGFHGWEKCSGTHFHEDGPGGDTQDISHPNQP